MNNSEKSYHSQEISQLLSSFNSSEHGLSSVEAKERLTKNGYNELPEVKSDGYFLIFLHQFKSPLVYILLVAGIIVFLTGETMDAVIILFVLFFNALIGTIQEGKAQNTFLALKKFIKSNAIVLRDDEETIISDREIVPGDIIVLREGEKVPADARILSSSSLKTSEAALTGESIPKLKTNLVIKDKNAPIMNRENMLYKGTTVVFGNGKALVVATGLNTFLGNIARETLGIDADFPLKNEIKKISRLVIIFTLIMSVVLFFLSLFDGYSTKDAFKTIVAISVSIIPEGLPIVITLVLASGVWRMGKKRVLVKKLQAVEVLGEIKILAVDKTGTVTKNELVVEKTYVDNLFFEIENEGYAPKGNIRLNKKIIEPLDHSGILLSGKIAALNSSANLIFEKKKRTWKIAGDPTEASLKVFSKKIGFQLDDLLSEYSPLDEIPFDYELKLHAALHQQKKSNFLSVTGSPEAILKSSENEWTVKGLKKMTAPRKNELQLIMQSMSQEGLRVIGFAFDEINAEKLDKKNLSGLTFVGFWGIKDALRKEVKNSVKQVSAFGIRTVMITGDHEITAKAIAREAGIWKEGDEVINGENLEKLKLKTLASRIKNISVFARITPNQKLKIIQAYKMNQLTIAMTGDGVNDALSLAAADIGIGMGKIGTEVAKEASDLILLDDNFGNIIHGVKEGRIILGTIKKVVLYLFSTSLGEVLVILAALALGLPLPILAVQILWLNLVTDGFLDIALAMETEEHSQDVSYKKTSLLDKLAFKRMFIMAVPMAIGTLYFFIQNYEVDITKAWTFSLTLLAAFQWFNAWNCRSAEKSIFQMNPLSNKFLIGATFLVISLQFLAVYNPFFQKILRTVPLTGKDWLVIIAVAASIIIVEETRKFFYRKNLR